jgi:transcription-repair coupling factor (superfamily II helicase)
MNELTTKSLSAERSALRRIVDRWRQYGPFLELKDQVTQSPRCNLTISGLAGSAEAFLLQSLAEETGRPILIVAERPDEAADLYDDLAFLIGDAQVGHYPARQILPYDFRAPVGEIMGNRIATLDGLSAGRVRLVVTSIRALMEPTIAVAELKGSRIDLGIGDETDPDELVRRLVRFGFRRVPLVEEVGDFAQRGGLIDFFTPGSDTPVRVEFFGNEVDTIRQFEVASQRTVGRLDRIQVLPRREVPITQETLEKYLERLPEDDAEYIRSRYLNDPDYL